jgi:predicted transcriptional regulator
VIKLGEVVMILDLHRQGLTVSAIARELGVDRKTVRRCIARGLETPVYGPRKPRKRLIDPFVRGHRRGGAFHDFEQGLLYALARDVAGDRWVVGLAGNLVDLVDIDDWFGG